MDELVVGMMLAIAFGFIGGLAVLSGIIFLYFKWKEHEDNYEE